MVESRRGHHCAIRRSGTTFAHASRHARSSAAHRIGGSMPLPGLSPRSTSRTDPKTPQSSSQPEAKTMARRRAERLVQSIEAEMRASPRSKERASLRSPRNRQGSDAVQLDLSDGPRVDTSSARIGASDSPSASSAITVRSPHSAKDEGSSSLRIKLSEKASL